MKANTKTSRRASQGDLESQLQEFIERFEPECQQLIRACRKGLQRRFPSTNELVYDNYNFFVIGYSPSERPSDTIARRRSQRRQSGVSVLRHAVAKPPQTAARFRHQEPICSLGVGQGPRSSRGRSSDCCGDRIRQGAPAARRARKAHYSLCISEAETTQKKLSRPGSWPRQITPKR